MEGARALGRSRRPIVIMLPPLPFPLPHPLPPPPSRVREGVIDGASAPVDAGGDGPRSLRTGGDVGSQGAVERLDRIHLHVAQHAGGTDAIWREMTRARLSPEGEQNTDRASLYMGRRSPQVPSGPPRQRTRHLLS